MTRSRRDLFIGAVAALTRVCPAAPGRAERPSPAVYRTRGCGCCPGWGPGDGARLGDGGRRRLAFGFVVVRRRDGRVLIHAGAA